MADTEVPEREVIVKWVHQFAPWMSEEEALDAYETYRSYVDEGQSALVARQYAGLL